MSSFTVKSASFEGPLEKVVELLQKRKLHVSDVSLAAIADDFVRYVESKEDTLEEISSFLKVMAILLLIKTKALLPSLELTDEEDTAVDSLKESLSRYKDVVKASTLIEGLLNEPSLFSRRSHISKQPIAWIPDASLTIEVINKYAKNLAQQEVRSQVFQRVKIVKKIYLDTVLSMLERRLSVMLSMPIDNIVDPNLPKGDKVVHFLAILELVKQGIASIQKESAKVIIQYDRIKVPTYGQKS